MTRSNKKRGLGRGLQALIPELKTMDLIEEVEDEEKIKKISINKIYPNKHQPRKNFNEETLKELADSIKIYGLIQPIVVTEREDGFMIISGERRWRAARIAELKEIPAIVTDYDERQLMEIALIENIQRDDLNAIEEANAYKYLMDTYKVKQEEIAEAVGKSRPYITNILRLLQLDNRIIEMIKNEEITPGHGKALLGIDDHNIQHELALKIINDKLSVRQIEELVRNLNKPIKKDKKEKPKDIFLLEIEENLKRFFGTKVNIVKGKKKGKIEIEYYNDEDLDRIVNLLEEIS